MTGKARKSDCLGLLPLQLRVFVPTSTKLSIAVEGLKMMHSLGLCVPSALPQLPLLTLKDFLFLLPTFQARSLPLMDRASKP